MKNEKKIKKRATSNGLLYERIHNYLYGNCADTIMMQLSWRQKFTVNVKWWKELLK